MNPSLPDREVAVRGVFGIDSTLTVPAFSARDEHVPDVDTAYRFNPEVTLALLAGFKHNRRVLVQGLHGTGKISRSGNARASTAAASSSAGSP